MAEISPEEWELLLSQARIRYEDALRQYWRANPRPLAADGSAYHLRSLARRRRR